MDRASEQGRVVSSEPFRLIELKVQVDMPSILMQLVDKDKLVRKIVDDEDIQFSWSILSANIEEEEDSVELLRHIVELWLAIRGKSLAQHMMEYYEQAKCKSTNKSKPLRKGLQQSETASQ